MNPKAAAWDAVGGRFWREGRASARPSAREIGAFLDGIVPGRRCAVVGASTKGLVEEALRRRLRTTVIDFSPVMLADLRAELPVAGYDCVCADATAEPPPELRDAVDAALSDRLINRFTHDDLRLFLRATLLMLAPGGELRTTVKLGFYPMDRLLIEEGKARGTLDRFWDEATRTIDYAVARDELEARLLPHGTIPRPVLLAWYHGRGRETRFSDEAIAAAVLEARADRRRFVDLRRWPCPDARDTQLYLARCADAG